jgi:hypothetical protein
MIDIKLPPYSSQSHCCLCGGTSGNTPLLRVKKVHRVALLKQKTLFLPDGARWCSDHFLAPNRYDLNPKNLGRSARYAEDSRKKVRVQENNFQARTEPYKQPEISDYRAALSLLLEENTSDPNDIIEEEDMCRARALLTWERVSFIEDGLRSLTGLADQEKWKTLAKTINELVHEQDGQAGGRNRLLGPYDTAFMFLAHLFLGLRSSSLSTLFGVDDRTIRRNIQEVRETLFDSAFRKEWIRCPRDDEERKKWTPESIAKVCPNVLAVVDCTYMWLENSTTIGDHSFSRKTHNPHHYSNQGYVKFITFTAPNGRLIHCDGPFGANEEDDGIFDAALEGQDELKMYLNSLGSDGVIYFDRGFRYAEQAMEENKIVASMKRPAYLGSRKAFPADVVEDQYEIARVRRVVEQMNGVWRRFALFKSEMPMAQIFKIFDTGVSPLEYYFTVSMALANFIWLPPAGH